MSAAYLATLDPQQRLAVEHGAGPQSARSAGALLVIAGAGSGKTSAFHGVGARLLRQYAHHIGVDPASKGREWKSVFASNVVDGCMPSDLATGTSAEIEEERRLLYVAMTHAKDELHLIVPQRFYTHGQTAHGDRHVYASRARFIPDSVLSFFAGAAWPRVEAAAAGSRSRDVRLDVKARMRGMWR